MKKLLTPLLLATLVLLPTLSPGWGFMGHRTIAQISVYALPKAMQPFYYHFLPRLVTLSTAPDERRETDPTEAPKHYIDMDHYGTDPFGAMPKAWEKAVAKYSADTLRKYGTVPWTVIDLKDQLTQAFRDGDTTNILKLSSDLGHYIGDAFVPLHTTQNYDGQMTNQTGIHSLWESKLPERHIAKYKLNSDEAKYVKDPLAAIWMTVQQSYGFLGATFDEEEKVTLKYTPETKYNYSHKYGTTRRSYSDAFADSYHDIVGGQVAYRLKQAPTLVASMWYTAWKDAGSPNLEKLLAHEPTKEEKDRLASDLKLWKDNQLVPQQRLLALEKPKAAARPDQIGAAVEMSTPAAADLEEKPQPAAAPTSAKATPPTPDKVKVKVKPTAAPATKTKVKAKKATDDWGTGGW
ncbi:hypothetical protein H8B15_07935 [Hymenobacter sp. BT507]|uniref:S1/P1 Nuclease n=1 Tax=Hymenobacter citatus TaxID=2763506 RepID=A0ABR7MID9_9BACT|nr:zinc dependent phospholipase C family protein [Hymenobacter citatus]MBC6610849.1 hypothetical protein [Hymenobacter citatus]